MSFTEGMMRLVIYSFTISSISDKDFWPIGGKLEFAISSSLVFMNVSILISSCAPNVNPVACQQV